MGSKAANKKLVCDALFVSDVHLGSNQSQANALRKFLKRVKPKTLYLVGDIVDLWAIKYNADIRYDHLTEIIEKIIDTATQGGEPDLRVLKHPKILRDSHIEVLEDIFALAAGSTKIVYVPGNHDIFFRRYDGLEIGNFSIKKEMIYTTPKGENLLVRHGDEYDTVLAKYDKLAHLSAYGEEHLSDIVNAFDLAKSLFWRKDEPKQGNPQHIMQTAVRLLAEHLDFSIPTGRRNDREFSLAFALEQEFKARTKHDYVLKSLLTEHLFTENARHFANPRHGGVILHGIINGHTHIPDASAFETPHKDRYGSPEGPCHILVLNDGSWARGERQIGRTALVVRGDGEIGMVQFDKDEGILPYQPPLFPFNTYPTQPCSHCGIETKILQPQP